LFRDSCPNQVTNPASSQIMVRQTIINNCRVFELLKLPKLCTYTSVSPTLSELSSWLAENEFLISGQHLEHFEQSLR
jgi:hypothetical protein